MRQTISGIIMMTSFFLLSCKSQKASRKEMLNDINEMCKCYRDGKSNSVKFMECSEKNEKVRDKYRAGNAQLAQYDADLQKCMAEK